MTIQGFTESKIGEDIVYKCPFLGTFKFYYARIVKGRIKLKFVDEIPF